MGTANSRKNKLTQEAIRPYNVVVHSERFT